MQRGVHYWLTFMFSLPVVSTVPVSDNSLYILSLKIFSRIVFNIVLIFAQNIDCGYTLEPPRRGGSNEYPQSMFWSKNKKNRYTPVNPSFTI